VYVSDRVKTIPEGRDLITKAEVALRGWDFPHTDKQAGAFADGVQSMTIRGEYREGYRLYRSGLFVWRRAYWEDVDKKLSKTGGRTLSFVSLIYSFTECLLFIRRLYEQIAPEATIHLTITLYGCKGRELASFDPMISWLGGYVSTEDIIPSEISATVADLRASYLELAARMVKHVFHVFNWFDATDEAMEHWQQKLLRKQF
jgi:hypothetical protein